MNTLVIRVRLFYTLHSAMRYLHSSTSTLLIHSTDMIYVLGSLWRNS